jgi:maltose/moltooligosaccharide transporter
MQLNYRQTFLLGFGFLGVSVIWTLYNAYVPIFLQSGNPEFAGTAKTFGFGLSAAWAGFIMTLDNIAALFIQPYIGVVSDRTRTRFGRRMPYILVGAPIAAIAFILIPLAPRLIPPELNGQLAQLGGPFALMMVAIGLTLLAMAIFRTPVIALMPDLIPSPLRSKANGIINFMGGVGGLLATFGGAALYGLGSFVPFVAGSVLLIVAVVILFIAIKEPKEYAEPEKEGPSGLSLLKHLREVPSEYRRSLFLLMGAIFCWFVGYNAIETFLSSYGVAVLKVPENRAALLLGVAQITFIIFAIPSGFIAGRFGRKRTILTGLAIFSVLLVVAYFMPSYWVIATLLGLGGMAWALVNINSLPMIVDIAPTAVVVGMYTGLYYLASQLAAVTGPILNGIVIDATGRNFNMIFFVAPFFFVLAMLCMLGVTRGEAMPSVE